MPGITISAGYGAGGSVVAPQVAARLGYPLLDRAISAEVAAKLHVTEPEAEGGAVKRTLVERFFGVLAPLAGATIDAGPDGEPIDAVPLINEPAAFREQADAIMRRAMTSGAVILGRAGSAAFRDEPGVLRVRLFGPDRGRLAQGARINGVDEQTAEQQLVEVDRARAQYVQRLYGCDINDPSLYHLQLDSTALRTDGCVETILAAYAAFPHD